MVEDHVRHSFQLDECADWISNNSFKRVVVQLKRDDLKYSVQIQTYLVQEHQRRSKETKQDYNLDIYISQPNCCCVDLIVTQHVNNVDALIHFGKVCLSEPHVNEQWNKPILFVFGRSAGTSIAETTIQNIIKLFEHEKNLDLLVLYDTNLVDQAIQIQNYFEDNRESLTNSGGSVEVADLHCPSMMWYTTPSHAKKFFRCDSVAANQEITRFDQYALRKPLKFYKCSIYVGNRPSLSLFLGGPGRLYRVLGPEKHEFEPVNVRRLLNRRISLVERLKDDEELRIGVIITNPLPSINELMTRFEEYAKKKKHTLYYITMVQTIDECKIGNFDLCDAFVIVSSCNCSTVLESLVYNRPIITELEFKLACGFEAEYGRVLWPGSSSDLTKDDIYNKRKVSDVSLALIHTRNELLERCSQARINKWSGLEFEAPSCNSKSDNIDSGIDGSGLVNVKGDDGLTIEDGLTGIASSYISEPSVATKCCDDQTQAN